jgi:uncharacterized SAM-binding protein YcdF (DUF218 family)
MRRALNYVVYLTNCVIYLTMIGAYSPIAIGPARVDAWLLLSLESRFPKWETVPHAPPDGIIVLGGESGERITASAKLSLRFPQARLLYSGFERFSGVEDYLQEFVRLGGDPARITVETRSHSTYENAVYSKALVKPNPHDHWLLITSAVHMPRAIGTFRHAGFNVEAYPVDFTQNAKDIIDGQAKGGEFAYREWIALLVYRLTERTDKFFPAP